MDIVDRIQDIVGKRNITIAALERETGLSNGIIKKWKKQSPSCDKIITIANYLNVSIEYLLLGKSSKSHLTEDEEQLLKHYSKLSKMGKGMVLGKAETLAELAAERAAQEAEKSKSAAEIQFAPAADEAPELEPEPEKEFYIDLCNLPASAGTGVYLSDGYTEPLQIKRTAIAERANYAVRVSGNSMETKFFDGDIVLVETCPYVEIGEIGIFIVNDEGFIKKRGEDRLISLNPECDDIFIHAYDTVYCRGRVLGKAEIVK